MLRKVVLPLVLVLLGGTATISGCKVPQIDMGSHSSKIDLGSRQEHAMGSDGIENGVSITHGELLIQNVWARPGFTGSNSAVYLNLQNNRMYPERFLGATTEFARAVEIHEVKMEGDLMLMRPVLSGIAIPAEGNLALIPSGYHLMLIDLQSDLSEGDYFPLALQFEQSGQVLVDVLVSHP